MPCIIQQYSELDDGTNYGLRLRISQQNQSIEQWASITAYTSIYPLISHLSCPSAQSVSILHKGLNAAFAFGARLIYISAGRNPVNLFFNTCTYMHTYVHIEHIYAQIGIHNAKMCITNRYVQRRYVLDTLKI